MFTRWAGWAVVVSLALGGCATTATVSPVSTVEPPLGPIPVITSPDQITMPIYSYLPTIDQTVAIMFTDQDLVNDCLAQRGSSLTLLIEDMHGSIYNMTPATINSVTTYVTYKREDDRTYNALWGFFNTTTVSTYGYDRPPDTPRIASLTGGDDPDAVSCMAQVKAVTPGGDVMYPFDFGELPDGGPPLPSDDSRFTQAEQQWSSCLAAQGFNYATPIDAIGFNTKAQEDTATAVSDADKAAAAAEVATAKALAAVDIQCKLDTNLVGIAVAVLSAYEQRYIDTHRDQLQALQQQIATYLSGTVTLPTGPEPSTTPS